MNYEYPLELVEAQVIGLDLGDNNLALQIENGRPVLPPSYAGPYEITPSDEAQVLETEGMLAAENIVINPIPSNRGLISWDGSILTVS